MLKVRKTKEQPLEFICVMKQPWIKNDINAYMKNVLYLSGLFGCYTFVTQNKLMPQSSLLLIQVPPRLRALFYLILFTSSSPSPQTDSLLLERSFQQQILLSRIWLKYY